MEYCTGSTSAWLTYTRSNGERVKREFKSLPIQIAILPASGGQFKFYGTGDDGIYYELTATGFTPSYTRNTGFNDRGYVPTMDGVLLREQDYYYVSGYSIATIIPPVAKNLISVTGNGNNFTDELAGNDGNYKVSCDDECPEGFCKCESPVYPGYCCLDCNSVAASIRAITNELRAKND